MPGHEDYGPEYDLNHAQYEALLEKGFEEELAEQIARTPGQNEGIKLDVDVRYEEWTKEELHDKARRSGIQEYWKMRLSDLIDLFREQERALK